MSHNKLIKKILNKFYHGRQSREHLRKDDWWATLVLRGEFVHIETGKENCEVAQRSRVPAPA